MSNVELARGSFEAFAKGDDDAYVNSFSEDTEWEVSAFLTGKDTYQGHEGVREFLGDVHRLEHEHDERFEMGLDEFIEVDDQVVLALGEARIVREINPLKFEVGTVYRFRDGKITHLQAYTSRDEARSAVGLD